MLEKKVGSPPIGGAGAGTVETAGKRTLVEGIATPIASPTPAHTQRKASANASADVHTASARGTSAPATTMPHGAMIQRLFGPEHDVGGIQAHVGGPAAAACDDMGAQAFASGNHVAFASSPDLHTAAHEAAHVVQQAQGVQLSGGVGAAGDPYERHADAVADRVVAGQSAADMLGPAAIPRKSEDGRSAVQRKLLHEGKEVTDEQKALQLLEHQATQHGRTVNFAAFGDAIRHLMQSPERYDLLDGSSDFARHALSSVILAINKHSGVEPGQLQNTRSVEEILALISSEIDLQKTGELEYTYRSGGTSKLESLLRGTEYEKLHTDGTSPRLFKDEIVKTDEPTTGLKIMMVGALRFAEREPEDAPIDLSTISIDLQQKAKELNEKYGITNTVAWRSHRLDTERRGTVGEYLAQENAGGLMPLPSGKQEDAELEQWHSVHFVGDVFTTETAPTAKRGNTDAGSELDLMNVRRSKAGLHCLAVGNVKVGKSNMAGAASQQNLDALALVHSFSDDKRVLLSSGDWAQVKQITAVDIATGKAVSSIQRPFTIESVVGKVTIGASQAPGDYTQRLPYTAQQIMDIAKCLKALGAKKEK